MSYFRQNIEAMEGYVPGEQPTDPAIVKLNTNENPYPPSPRVMEAIAAIEPEQLRRYPDPMANRFRDTAARVLGVSREQVICANGMDELLNLTVRAFSGPEAALVYPTPSYTLYAVLAQIQASMMREVPFPLNYELPIDGLVNARGSVTYVVNPNSPTGTFVEPQRLGELAGRLDGVLCIDEAYVDFARTDCLELARTRPNVLVMRTMSKGYALAGLRFGFAVGHQHLIDGLVKVKDSYNVDAISIAAASAALEDQAYRNEMRQKVIAERQRVAGALGQMGLHCLPSESNFLLCRAGKPHARELYEQLKARRILVRYFNYSGVDDSLRITVGTPPQNDALLVALSELMRKV